MRYHRIRTNPCLILILQCREGMFVSHLVLLNKNLILEREVEWPIRCYIKDVLVSIQGFGEGIWVQGFSITKLLINPPSQLKTDFAKQIPVWLGQIWLGGIMVGVMIPGFNLILLFNDNNNNTSSCEDGVLNEGFVVVSIAESDDCLYPSAEWLADLRRASYAVSAALFVTSNSVFYYQLGIQSTTVQIRQRQKPKQNLALLPEWSLKVCITLQASFHHSQKRFLIERAIKGFKFVDPCILRKKAPQIDIPSTHPKHPAFSFECYGLFLEYTLILISNDLRSRTTRDQF